MNQAAVEKARQIGKAIAESPTMRALQAHVSNELKPLREAATRKPSRPKEPTK